MPVRLHVYFQIFQWLSYTTYTKSLCVHVAVYGDRLSCTHTCTDFLSVRFSSNIPSLVARAAGIKNINVNSFASIFRTTAVAKQLKKNSTLTLNLIALAVCVRTRKNQNYHRLSWTATRTGNFWKSCTPLKIYGVR